MTVEQNLATARAENIVLVRKVAELRNTKKIMNNRLQAMKRQRDGERAARNKAWALTNEADQKRVRAETRYETMTLNRNYWRTKAQQTETAPPAQCQCYPHSPSGRPMYCPIHD